MLFLKKILDRLYDEYDFSSRLAYDPIEFPHRYSDPGDIEAAGFIASCFSYGNVRLFKPVIQKILNPAGEHPARFFMDFDVKKDKGYLKGASYRFNREKDILCLVYVLGTALKEKGSLKNLFYEHFSQGSADIRNAISGFTGYLNAVDTAPVYGRNIRPYGITQLIPSPVKGSACKRMNLFLRWMVRERDTDFGLWDRVPPAKLIIPLDTHIARIARCIGLTKRSASNWKTAVEITAALRRYDPEDPLKYDFALCHHGISGRCRGEKKIDTCPSCVFNKYHSARGP